MVGRVFKTKRFARDARKARIDDPMLCAAIREVQAGRADDLGGGVYKKRLDDNRQRSIILTTAGAWWVYAYLFAKQDRDNIADDELAGFRLLAKAYAAVTPAQLRRLLDEKDLTEICDGQAEIQD